MHNMTRKEEGVILNDPLSLDQDTSSVVMDDGVMMMSMIRGASASFFFSVGTLPYDMEWSQSKITLTNEAEKGGW